MPPTLHVSGDRLTATLALPAGTHLGLGDIRALLTTENVHAGLDSQALLAATKESVADRRLVVARGRAPQPGADGRLELLIQESGSVYAEGTVDLAMISPCESTRRLPTLPRSFSCADGFDREGFGCWLWSAR